MSETVDKEVLSANDPKTIVITQDNYENYFNMLTGKILDSADISDGDTLKIGNISGRAFVIDRQLTIMPLNEGDEIKNGFIHLIAGSDGSTVSHMIINNTKSTLTLKGITVGQLHGIWLTNTNNNLIEYNIIRIANAAGVYSMPMGWSSNNRIIYNDMNTYITSNIVMGECHYNLISDNKIEVLSYSDYVVSNLIYFNPFGHADFTGSGLCVGNTIVNNYLKGFCTSPMTIIVQMDYANHDNTVIANNTIIKGSFGVNVKGNNISVHSNKFEGSANAIAAYGNNISIKYNELSGLSHNCGIYANSTNVYEAIESGMVSGIEVAYNTLEYTDLVYGIGVGYGIYVHDNIINIKNYGIGISISANNATVCSNNVNTNHDSGIRLYASYAVIDGNIIKTNAIGIEIPKASGVVRYYNNTIINNKITSESYGISIEGLVYNSIISDNVIESNKTNAFNIDITDRVSNTESDNIVNGVILNATAIVVNDGNFYQYFDEDGYLTYEFEEGRKNKIIFLTFLSNKNIIFDDKVNVISNKMDNLLFNVTITFESGSEGSLLRDFNFMNYDREAVIIDGASDITVSNNNFTDMFKSNKADSVILIKGICDDIVIASNNIYTNAKSKYSYAINAPVINKYGFVNDRLSTGLSVRNNVIIMISTNVAEAIYTDAFTSSEFRNNKINIISDGAAYGISFAKMSSKLSNINVTNNEIVIHSNDMAYLIEFHIVDNSTIANNKLYSDCNSSFAIGLYHSCNINVTDNEITLFGGNLDKNTTLDVLGLGNSPISLINNVKNITIAGNLIYTNVTNPILFKNVDNVSSVNITSNSYVIDNSNINVFFDSNNQLIPGIISCYNRLLINNITGGQILEINVPVNVSSYNNLPISVKLIFTGNASGSSVVGFNFINSTIVLDNVSDIVIKDSIFNSSNSKEVLQINNGSNNVFEGNILNITSNGCIVNLINSSSNKILNNEFTINGFDVVIIENKKSNYTLIDANHMEANATNSLIFVNSYDSQFDNIRNNTFNGNATNSIFGYLASNVHGGLIEYNEIYIRGLASTTNQSGIYYKKSSSNNTVTMNDVLSYSADSKDYAVVVISDRNLGNSIYKNYLISSNGAKKSNFAVYAPFDFVDRNTPLNIYVSVNGSDIYGDGSISNPYASISAAVKNALNHAIIYVSDGYYYESDITVDKDLQIIASNQSVVIDAGFKQLFTITQQGSLCIDSIYITNAYSEYGGSAFINRGELSIINSSISNSSSYHDNSHPVFDRDVVYDENGDVKSAHTQNYINTGRGGAILNYGTLNIESSVFYENFGHWGGVIADYGKTSINSSLFFNNRGVHGGVIYTNSKNKFDIDNSMFMNNTAIVSLDFCSISKSVTVWSIDTGYSYAYYSDCGTPVGIGGVLYTHVTSLSLTNSNFTGNAAKCGGVIATQIDSFASLSTFESQVDLFVENCSFVGNMAKDTRYSTGDVVDLDYFSYKTGFNGGAIYGTFNKFQISASEFYYNVAGDNGGAVHAKANDGKILDSKFISNTAGISGGALDLSKNFVILRTIISNNIASYGGAINYDSYSYYGHIQSNLNIYNSTISNNKALTYGGAFDIGTGNITIHDSNIVNNLAPGYGTIHTTSSSTVVDLRYNYWGTTDGVEGPDNSIWNFDSNLFKPWSKQWINWDPKNVELKPSTPSTGSEGSNNNPRPSAPNVPGISSGSTGSSTSTGSSIGGNSGNSGGGNGQYGGSGDGTNLGPGSGSGTGNSLLDLPGNSEYKGQAINGMANSNSSNNHQSVNGDVDSDSLSKVNSSNYDANLLSVGMVSNAASTSSASGEGADGSSSAADSQSSKAYEITKKIELPKESEVIISFIMIMVVLLLLVVGYKRKQGENDETY